MREVIFVGVGNFRNVDGDVTLIRHGEAENFQYLLEEWKPMENAAPIPQADPDQAFLIRITRAIDELHAAMNASGGKILNFDADRIKAIAASVR